VSHTPRLHGMRVTGCFTCIGEPRASREGLGLAPSGLLPLAAGSQLTQQPLAGLVSPGTALEPEVQTVPGAADVAVPLCTLGTHHLPWSVLGEAVLR